MNIFRRYYLMFVAWRRGYRLPHITALLVQAPIEGEQHQEVVKPLLYALQRQRPLDNFGALYFREDLLDQLSNYFHDLREMKRLDPHSYALYRRLGGQIATRTSGAYHHQLDPIFVANLPTWGLTYFRMSKKEEEEGARHDMKKYGEECVYPVLLWYCRRKRHLCGVEYRRGTMYEVNAMFIDRKNTDLRHINTYYVAVDQGKVTVLREQQWLRYRRARDNAQGTWSPPGSQRHWIYPLQSWADFHDYKVNEYLCWLFCMVATQPSVAQAGIQVRVRKNDMAALFNIDMLRTPYFFDDRTKEKGATGKTKKIFHIVRAHRRRIGDGSTVVHTHFRGLRDFIWNGYGVHISVPGLHHVPYQEFNADTVDDSQISKGEKIHTGAEMAQWVISESPVRAPPYKSIYNANCHLIKTRPPKIINEN